MLCFQILIDSEMLKNNYLETITYIIVYTVGRQLSERVGTEGIRITEMFG